MTLIEEKQPRILTYPVDDYREYVRKLGGLVFENKKSKLPPVFLSEREEKSFDLLSNEARWLIKSTVNNCGMAEHPEIPTVVIMAKGEAAREVAKVVRELMAKWEEE